MRFFFPEMISIGVASAGGDELDDDDDFKLCRQAHSDGCSWYISYTLQSPLHHVYQAPPLGFPSSLATETDLFSTELSQLLSFELEKQRIEMEAYLDLEFSQLREMSNMVPRTPLTHVVPGQPFGNQSQYSYRPEVIGGSSGGGMMWVGGNGGGSGGHDNNYNLSSPSFTSSLGSWAPAGQKRTRDEESNSITQIPGQRLHLQRRGIEGSSSFSSAVREQTASITPATIAATPTSGMTQSAPPEIRKYRGVRQRPWGKWAAEIRDPHRKVKSMARYI